MQINKRHLNTVDFDDGTFGLDQHNSESEQAQLQSMYDEFSELMSLALDGRMEPWQQERFDHLREISPQLGAEWALWGFLDQRFKDADNISPPVGFEERVVERLMVAERRRRLRFGLMIALTYVLLWGTIAIGTASLGMLLFWARPIWLVELLVVGRVWAESMGTWLDALRSTALALISTPQIRNAGLVYIVASIALLFGWMRLLQISTRSQETLSRI